METFSPRGFWGSTALPTPWFLTSAFENPERINFCHFKPPNLWHFATSAPGNQYRCYP